MYGQAQLAAGNDKYRLRVSDVSQIVMDIVRGQPCHTNGIWSGLAMTLWRVQSEPIPVCRMLYAQTINNHLDKN